MTLKFPRLGCVIIWVVVSVRMEQPEVVADGLAHGKLQIGAGGILL